MPLYVLLNAAIGPLNLVWDDQTYKNKKLHENAAIEL